MSTPVLSESDSSAAPAAPAPPRELLLLLTLAAMQFANILDFMIIMPMGPHLMRIFELDPQHFGFLVSSYTFAAAASGFVAVFWVDHVSRKRAASLLAGLIIGRAADGTLTRYHWVGWCAVACTLLAIVLARTIRVIPDGSAVPE